MQKVIACCQCPHTKSFSKPVLSEVPQRHTRSSRRRSYRMDNVPTLKISRVTKCLLLRIFKGKGNRTVISSFSKQGEVRTTNCQLDTGWGMCYKHDECSNWFGSKSSAMSLLQKVSSSGYTLGCYYDPFTPYHLSGDFHHFEANLSVAACVKLCGEDGYMLAGLRWRLLTQTSLCMIRVPLQGPSILPLWKR